MKHKLLFCTISAMIAAGAVMPVMAADIPAAAVISAEEEHTVETKKVPLVWRKYDQPKEITLYFLDGNTAVPYLEIEDFVALKNEMAGIEERESVISECRKEENKVTLVRDNGAECEMDFDRSTVSFEDFDQFIQQGCTDALVTPIWRHPAFEDGTPKYFMRSKASVNRHGEPIRLDLAAYGIDLIRQGSEYYAPMQTLSDILLGEMTNFLIYNGERVFIDDSDMRSSTETELFYSAPKGTRSAELADFNYKELMFALDFNYGQKKEQHISDFDFLVTAQGLKEPLLSADPQEATHALKLFMDRILGGGHNWAGCSYLVEDTDENPFSDTDTVRQRSGDLLAEYGNAREQEFWKNHEEDTMPPVYQEVGDTAILSFQGFEFADDDVDYYETEVTEDMLGYLYRGIDTIGLIKYAHQQITRPDSPIENVVIDLTTNAGGDVDAGTYMLAWILGEAPLSMRSALTGATTTAYYRCDANYDHVFDDQDSLKALGKNVYCLTSPFTFSCANLVACILQHEQGATILGKTSGGGTCSVLPLCTADGTSIGISSRNMICTAKNGTYYSVDQGATPDVPLSHIESFYDYDTLTDIIHSLY